MLNRELHMKICVKAQGPGRNPPRGMYLGVVSRQTVFQARRFVEVTEGWE